MKRMVVLGLSIFLLFSLTPKMVSADCLDLSVYTSWALQDPQTIIFYKGKSPLAIVKMLDCTIQPTSRVRLLQGYVCSSDQIEIDGQACSILTVQVID